MNTPAFLSWFIPHWIEKHVEEIDLQDLTIEAQAFVLPEDLSLHGLELTFEYEEKPYSLSIAKVTLYNIVTFWKEHDRLEFLIEDLSGQRDSLGLKTLNLKGVMLFREAQLSRAEGIFAGRLVQIPPYTFENAQGRFRYHQDKLEIFELKTFAGGGELKGQVSFSGFPEVSFVSWLEVNDLNPQLMTDINRTLLAQLDGKLDGTLRVLGQGDRVDLLSLSLEFDGSGVIRAPLVEKIVASPGHKVMKHELQDFLTAEGHLPVPEASLRLQNTNAYRLSLQYSIEDSSRHFHLKENQEQYIAEGIQSLIFPLGLDSF